MTDGEVLDNVKNDKRYKKTGISIMRISVLILCIISLRNTAFGLEQYIFADAPWMAVFLSIVFQGIIAVMALQWKRIIPKNGGNNKNHRLYSWAVLSVLVISLGFSIIFDFVYIVNSTYQITEKSNIESGISQAFLNVKKEISGQLDKKYDEGLKMVYDKIGNMGNELNGVGTERFVTKWPEYWAVQKEKYRPIVSGYSLYELAMAKSLNDANSREATLTYAEIMKEKESYANNVVYAKLTEVIDQVTLLEPAFITESEICSLIDAMTTAENYIKGLLESESMPSQIIEKVETEQIISEEIFSQSAERLNAKLENWKQESRDAQENSLTQKKENADWQWRITVNQQELLNELSQKRIAVCKEGISVLNGYKRMLLGIQEDAKYNLALLVREISSSEQIDAKKIDEITAKISQTVFAIDSDAQAKECFKHLKEAVSDFIPVKNSYILLNSINISTEENLDTSVDFDTTEKEERTETDNKEIVVGKEGVRRYKESIKSDLDSLIENLMTVSAEDDAFKTAIADLFEIERVFLTEKNELVKAFDYFRTPKVRGEKIHNSRGKGMAIFCAIFALMVDILSIIIGVLVQKMDDKEYEL